MFKFAKSLFLGFFIDLKPYILIRNLLIIFAYYQGKMINGQCLYKFIMFNDSFKVDTTSHRLTLLQ